MDITNNQPVEVSVIIPTFNEAGNIGFLVGKVKEIFNRQSLDYEIIVSDAGSTDQTPAIAAAQGARVIFQQHPGYGGALKDAIASSRGRYIITLDADLSHNPYLINRFLLYRKDAHIVLASRYTWGGFANMPLLRLLLSRLLNKFLCLGLSLPLTDVSSGFRIYDARIFPEIDFSEENFSVLSEILVRAYMKGFTVKEIPFHYQPRSRGSSHARIFKFGVGFLRTFFRLWKMRNTIASADYDERAFYSRIPFQRFWQRRRYRIICSFAGFADRILDIGCGSSKILGAFPQAVGADINFNKLRHNMALGNIQVNADIQGLCFKDGCFDLVICSEVIEHINRSGKIFEELSRVLKKGGYLILGTPDYSRFNWRVIEWLYKKIIPGGYADEHITHYSRHDLVSTAESFGFKLEDHQYIVGSELICKFLKQY